MAGAALAANEAVKANAAGKLLNLCPARNVVRICKIPIAL
jgi:hypothetical protein